jgi:hypothetical protein
MKTQDERSSSAAIPTAGEIFPGGIALELLRDPGNSEKLSLVSFREGAVEIKSEMLQENRVYVPISINPSVARAVRFPTRVAGAESTKTLFTDVHGLLRRHLGQLDSCITGMVFAIFVSWLSPALPMAPVLSIFAPPGSPKDLTLQLLSLLCRRPLCLAGAKRSDLLRVPMSLQPTLLLDEPDLQPAMQAILQAGTYRGRCVPAGDGVRELFGPKIICTRKPAQGAELEAVGLRVALIPASGQLPFLDENEQREIADQFQARFLGYFLRNCGRAQVQKCGVSDLAQPLQDLTRAFGMAVSGDDELLARILPLLKIRDEEMRSDRAGAFDSVVLEAILSFIHQGGWSKVRMDGIADRVSAIFKGRGFDEAPSPERVGWAVKRLNIPSGRINRAGNGIELTEATRRLVHELAFSYGVRAMQAALPGECQSCRELRSAVEQV